MHDNRRLSAAMMTHSWHPDLHLVDESAAPPTSTASHYRRASRQSTASSASPDFEPLDAAAVGGRETSFLDEASPRVNGLRNSKRIAFGTLKRSESGEHLLLSEGAPPQAPQLPMMTLALPVNDSITVVSTSSSENSPGAGSVTIVTTPDRPPNLSRHGLYRRAVHHRPSPPLSGQSSLSPEDTSEAELDDMLPGPI
uniref:Uncharacterized protein n=1 Tax=Plectus sambesii TaxID=2011161 RepID=A0A914VL96_9BILA